MECLIDNKKSITIEDLSTNKITNCKNIISLKEFLLDSILLNPIILVTDNLYVDKNTGEKSRIYDYSTSDSKITFTDKVFMEYPELKLNLNSKRMRDMFIKTRSEINNGDMDIYIEIAEYSERKNICGISKNEEFMYTIFADKDGKIGEDEIVYLSKLVDIYLDNNGVKRRELANLGKIYSEDRSFIGLGEPIESIISRKVLNYGRKS